MNNTKQLNTMKEYKYKGFKSIKETKEYIKLTWPDGI